MERREKKALASSRLSSTPPPRHPGRMLLFEEPSCKGTWTNHRDGDKADHSYGRWLSVMRLFNVTFKEVGEGCEDCLGDGIGCSPEVPLRGNPG